MALGHCGLYYGIFCQSHELAGDIYRILFAQVLQMRVWQAPLLAMFSVTFAGTLFMHLVSYGFMRLGGVPLSFSEVVGLITLPSLLLNMLFAIPVYAFMRDLARWVYPPEEYE
jgi:hypothetical protein